MTNSIIKYNYAIHITRKYLWVTGCWPQKDRGVWYNVVYSLWTFIAYMFILGIQIIILSNTSIGFI